MNLEEFRLAQRLNRISSTDIDTIYTLISEIDFVKKNWHLTKKLSPHVIERLTQSVIVTSTGASNRIEGNRLTDDQVNELYKELSIKKLKSRDDQEVAGYLEILSKIFTHYNDIPIDESHILAMHTLMLQHSERDSAHKGRYKVSSNRVEAKNSKGETVGVIFDPTAPYLVKKEMNELIDWYNWALKNAIKHPLILIGNFIFEFLAIHPFQDGNGRCSRLLTNLMLLHNNYQFTTFVSHEKIIEEHKVDYYLALNKTQSSWKSDTENIAPWLLFFLTVIKIQAQQALKILEEDSIDYSLSEKQLALWKWALTITEKTFSRKEAVAALGFPERTVESIIKKLLEKKKLERHGQGRATYYKVVN